jgi:hypothetical protein
MEEGKKYGEEKEERKEIGGGRTNKNRCDTQSTKTLRTFCECEIKKFILPLIDGSTNNIATDRWHHGGQ